MQYRAFFLIGAGLSLSMGDALCAPASDKITKPIPRLGAPGGGMFGPADSMSGPSMGMDGPPGMMGAMSGPTMSGPTKTAESAPDPAGVEFFEKNVRPVLAQSCYSCHSSAAGKARGGLTLDTRAGWEKGGKSGPAIVPGKPDESLLHKAVTYKDEDLQMPPAGKLPDAQIAAIKEWIAMGAPDPRAAKAHAAGAKEALDGLSPKARAHWAFQPVRNYAVSKVKNGGWVKMPPDNFILAKIEANGMKPNPPASKEALIRRATYDLIGLPPTVEEVRAFEEDNSEYAFYKVVDRLLASPQYGERWARHWLDSARYSDTRGLVSMGGKYRFEDYRYANAWLYRDYVIQAFNEDKPYNKFLMEQLAADKLPDIKPNDPRLAALGFLTVGKRFENNDDTIDERIDTVTKATLGLTVSCARCHDHKFDPIPTADYYSLHGVFASTVEPYQKPELPDSFDPTQRGDYEHKLATLEARNRQVIHDMLRDTLMRFMDKAEGYLVVATMRGNSPERYDTAKKYGVFPEYGPENQDIFANIRLLNDHPVFGPFAQLRNLKPEEFAVKAAELLPKILNDKKKPVNSLVVEGLANLKPQSIVDVAKAYDVIFARARPWVSRYFQAMSTPGQKPAVTEPIGEVLNSLFWIPPADEIATVEGQLTYFTDAKRPKPWMASINIQNNANSGKLLFPAINELRLTNPGAPGGAMVLNDAPQPKDSYIYLRGDRNKRGPVVPRQFLEALSGPNRKPFTEGSGRLELAKAIADPKNPLTARVIVNRVWMYHFGEGLVRTPDDLGNMAEKPSHPELLDWLARWFVQNDWSIKELHRLIMFSATYQQSSAPQPAYEQRDPDNRLLRRANLRRIDFESMRDSMVLLTGKLDPLVGGKPANITDEPYSYRRSIYGYVDRTFLSDLMGQFDFSNPEMTNTRRISTIVPQQALFFMNSPMSVDVARQVTSRSDFEAAKDDAARVRVIYSILFQRAPSATEIAWAREFLNKAGEFEKKRLAASGGKAPVVKKATVQRRSLASDKYAVVQNVGEPVERAPLTPWQLYTQALLCSNEFVYVN